MKLTVEHKYMWSVLHRQYHACWCSGDLRSQCISRHGTDPQNSNFPPPASEELSYCRWDLSISQETSVQFSLAFSSKYKHFLPIKCMWKCHLQNGSHFVQTPMGWGSTFLTNIHTHTQTLYPSFLSDAMRPLYDIKATESIYNTLIKYILYNLDAWNLTSIDSIYSHPSSVSNRTKQWLEFQRESLI